MKTKTFFIEMTDTFAGDANYSWIQRFKVTARTTRGAIHKLSKETGCSWRKDYDTGDMARYDAKGACVCCFVEEYEEEFKGQYKTVDL